MKDLLPAASKYFKQLDNAVDESGFLPQHPEFNKEAIDFKKTQELIKKHGNRLEGHPYFTETQLDTAMKAFDKAKGTFPRLDPDNDAFIILDAKGNKMGRYEGSVTADEVTGRSITKWWDKWDVENNKLFTDKSKYKFSGAMDDKGKDIITAEGVIEGGKSEIKKDRVATADELEEYTEILDPTGETGVVEEGMTIRQLDDMVVEQKAYEADMYRQYKRGDLDPVAGDKSPARKRFLEKKMEEMEMSGDKRLMTIDEIEELSSFDLGTEMDIKKGIDDVMKDTSEAGLKKSIETDNLKLEFPGITDEMIENILTDTNPQRIAEVKATMKEALLMREKGMSPEAIMKALEDAF